MGTNSFDLIFIFACSTLSRKDQTRLNRQIARIDFYFFHVPLNVLFNRLIVTFSFAESRKITIKERDHAFSFPFDNF